MTGTVPPPNAFPWHPQAFVSNGETRPLIALEFGVKDILDAAVSDLGLIALGCRILQAAGRM